MRFSESEGPATVKHAFWFTLTQKRIGVPDWTNARATHSFDPFLGHNLALRKFQLRLLIYLFLFSYKIKSYSQDLNLRKIHRIWMELHYVFDKVGRQFH